MSKNKEGEGGGGGVRVCVCGCGGGGGGSRNTSLTFSTTQHLLIAFSSLEIQESGTIKFEIPVDRLTNTDHIDLKSQSFRVGPLDVYLRLTAGRGADTTVNVQLCAAKPFIFAANYFRELCVSVDMEHNLGRRVGGVHTIGESVLEVKKFTKMTELNDGSGDKGAGGSLSVEHYSSRVMYDGDGEVTTDGPGSAAERAGEAAG